MKDVLQENESLNKNIQQKILYFFSMTCSSKNSSWGEEMKTVLDKIIKIESILKLPEKKISVDLCMLIPNSRPEIKLFLLEKIVKEEHSKIINQKIIDIFFNFFKIESNEINLLNKSMKLFSVFFMKNKLEKLFNKQQKKILIQILSNKSFNDYSVEDLQFFFYAVFSSREICRYQSLNLPSLFSKHSQLKTEIELLNSLTDYGKTFGFSYEKFSEIYGKKNSEEIMAICKAFAVKEFFSDNLKKDKKIFSFDELEKSFKLSFEELEEVLIEGDNNSLFKLKINYEGKTVKTLYVKKNNFTKEEMNKLKEDVTKLKGKIEAIYNAVDKI